MVKYRQLLKIMANIAAVSLMLTYVFLFSQQPDESTTMLEHDRVHAANLYSVVTHAHIEDKSHMLDNRGAQSQLEQHRNSTVNIVHEKTNYSSLYHCYGDSVDLRIIVLTYNRPMSLSTTLQSLQGFITDGFHVTLEIWIDKGANSTQVDPATLQVARDFQWSNGATTVWIHTRHVGLFGQWLYTWRPRMKDGNVDMHEWALFVEDDVDVSKYGYKWLRAVHEQYKSRDDVACYTLQDENAIGSRGKYRNKEIKKPSNSPVFFHRLPGSWAMSPHPQKWRRFQDWFETYKENTDFRPYVQTARIQTEWYKIFEEQKRQDTMWTMWYIYYTSKRNQICAYANLPTFTGQSGKSISSNRKEPGLHYNAKLVAKDYIAPKLLDSWNDSYVHFPVKPPVYDFDGNEFKPKGKKS